MNNTVECFAIILIIVLVAAVYMRAGKKGIAFSVLPVISVPVFHCIAWLVCSNFLSKVSSVEQVNMVYIIFDIVGLGIGLLLCGLCANGFKKKTAVIYLSTVALFNVIFTSILLVNNLQLILDK